MHFIRIPIEDGGVVLYAGEPAGLVIRLPGGFTIYHAGDTALFGDMKLIGELYKPDVAMLPIGDLLYDGAARGGVCHPAPGSEARDSHALRDVSDADRNRGRIAAGNAGHCWAGDSCSSNLEKACDSKRELAQRLHPR